MKPDVEPMLMIRPLRRSSIVRQDRRGCSERGHEVELQVGPPLRGSRTGTGDRHVPPTLLTSTSIRPKAARVSATIPATSSSTVIRPAARARRRRRARGELRHELARDGVAADDHHPGALGRERQRDPAADVRGRGGDDDDLACQSRLHGLLPERRPAVTAEDCISVDETTETTPIRFICARRRRSILPMPWISPEKYGPWGIVAADRTDRRGVRARLASRGSTSRWSPAEKTSSRHRQGSSRTLRRRGTDGAARPWRQDAIGQAPPPRRRSSRSGSLIANAGGDDYSAAFLGKDLDAHLALVNATASASWRPRTDRGRWSLADAVASSW